MAEYIDFGGEFVQFADGQFGIDVGLQDFGERNFHDPVSNQRWHFEKQMERLLDLFDVVLEIMRVHNRYVIYR